MKIRKREQVGTDVARDHRGCTCLQLLGMEERCTIRQPPLVLPLVDTDFVFLYGLRYAGFSCIRYEEL